MKYGTVPKYDLQPNNLQIELVEGCNRMCEFCGIHSIWKNKKNRKVKFMSLDIAQGLAYDIGLWLGRRRIEFAMHGEPTLHPYLHIIIGHFRNFCPLAQLQLTTNGSGLVRGGYEYVNRLFESGLNVLLLDLYEPAMEEAFKKIRHKLNIHIAVQNFYDTDYNCYHYNGYEDKVILLVGDLGKYNRKKAQRVILNHAGNVNPEAALKYGAKIITAPLNKICTRPFREMSIHWDGTIPLCCIDWRHEHIIGKYPEDGTPEDIWFSRQFDVMRFFLGNKNRNFTPCHRCDYNGGFRVGLIRKVGLEEREAVLRAEVIQHFVKYRKYAHPNADPVMVYEPNASGVRRFIPNA